MKIDNELARELKKAQGDGSREAKFALLRQVSSACNDLSKPDVRTTFYDKVKSTVEFLLLYASPQHWKPAKNGWKDGEYHGRVKCLNSFTDGRLAIWNALTLMMVFTLQRFVNTHTA